MPGVSIIAPEQQAALLRFAIETVTGIGELRSPDVVISDVLAATGAAVGLDRIWVTELADNEEPAFVVPFQWMTTGVRAIEPTFFAQFSGNDPAIVAWHADLARREPVVVTVRSTAPTVSRLLAELQLQSMLLMPFFDWERLSGHLGFGSSTLLDAWDESELDTLRLVSQLVGSIARAPNANASKDLGKRRNGFWGRPFSGRKRTQTRSGPESRSSVRC